MVEARDERTLEHARQWIGALECGEPFEAFLRRVLASDLDGMTDAQRRFVEAGRRALRQPWWRSCFRRRLGAEG
jgi:hypothetical protein